jgi:hypothetical protein
MWNPLGHQRVRRDEHSSVQNGILTLSADIHESDYPAVARLRSSA